MTDTTQETPPSATTNFEMPWETYYDDGYFQSWAVRLKSDLGFSRTTLFHLPSKKEAEALCDILNELELQRRASAEEASRWYTAQEAPEKRTLVWAAWASKFDPGRVHSAATWTDSKDFKTCKRWAYLPTPPVETAK